MHYKNGRIVSVKDWVVGISHNSENQTVCGYVVAIMPQQGNCNIKLLRWRDEHFTENGAPRTDEVGSAYHRPIEDYGDCKEFIRVDDGLRMVAAVVQHGDWKGPYSQTKSFEH